MLCANQSQTNKQKCDFARQMNRSLLVLLRTSLLVAHISRCRVQMARKHVNPRVATQHSRRYVMREPFPLHIREPERADQVLAVVVCLRPTYSAPVYLLGVCVLGVKWLRVGLAQVAEGLCH